MLSMGDEVRRTQYGNNNAYCQDNETSWFDWSLLEENSDIHRFVKQLISFRLNLDVFKEERNMCLVELLDLAQFQWHGVKLDQPDWGNDSHSLAFTVRGVGERFHIILNAYWEALEFELPTPPRGSEGWRRIVDTYLKSPQDFCEREDAPVISASSTLAQPRSVVVLAAEILRKRGTQT